MNTQKAIKAEQDYVLRNAVVAAPEEYPVLCRIFAEVIKRKPCGRRLTLMVGECNSAGLAMWRSRRTGVILINRKAIPAMTEDEMRCLLGHELGHFEIWRELDTRREPLELHKNMHPALSHLYSGVYEQISADLAGVEQCRSVSIAASHLSDGDSEMEAVFNDPWHALPEKFYPDFELAMRIKALGMLAKSEYYYELLGSELLGFGRWQITSDEYLDKINHMFDPFMNFTEDDAWALGAFLSGALFIAGCRAGEAGWSRELDLLADYGEPQELLKFASIDAAYERIVSVAASIHGMRHPLKHIVWNYVWDLTLREWEDSDEALRFDDFLAACERGQAVMPVAKHDRCDEDLECDDSDYPGDFVYYDEAPATDTYVA